MIISDQCRFILVHIPKCAGVSVKKELYRIDDSDGAYSKIGDHPELGTIHFAHIPLSDLKAYFPETYAKFGSYRSVAIVRDPLDRFVSAIFQRLREFKGFNQSAITPQVFQAEALLVTRHLASSQGRLSVEYVHFNRQSDYVIEGSRQIANQVFRLDQLDHASEYIECCTGIRIDTGERLNRSAGLNGGRLQPVFRLLRVPYAFLVPIGAREKVRTAMLRTGLFGDIAKTEFLKPGSWLHDFLKDYYQDDFVIFADAWRSEAAPAEARSDAPCLA